MSFNVIQCHSLSSLTVTILSCSLQLPLLDLSLSLSLSLPLPLDEPALIDAKEDKEPAPSDMSIIITKLSLYSTDTGSVVLSFLTPPCRLDHRCKEFSCSQLWQKGTKGPATTEYTLSVQIPAVTIDLQCK